MKHLFACLAFTAALGYGLIFTPLTFAGTGPDTSFTYQGQLSDGGSPANGSYDLTFSLFEASVAGQLDGTQTNLSTGVTNGLFTVTIDFGTNFPGADRWLEIAARTNGAVSFTTLAPRQKLTPTPYAITAENVTAGAGLAGTYSGAVTLNNTANVFAGNGASISNVNALTLGGLAASNYWNLAGNSAVPGQFLGTTVNAPLELWVNSVRGWRLEPKLNDVNHSNIVNLIGGSSVNFVSNGVYGATISGGGSASYLGNPSGTNIVGADFGTVGGGRANASSGYAGTVGGGAGNLSSGFGATVAGGQANQSTNTYDTVGGGYGNRSVGINSTVAGGYQNNSGNDYATVSGGANAQATGPSSFIGGGGYNGTLFLGNSAAGTASVVTGGFGNSSGGTYTTTAGGYQNSSSGYGASLGGGYLNASGGYYSAVAGGGQNSNNADYGSIGGGFNNVATGTGSVIGGGGYDGTNFQGNLAGGVLSTISGGFGDFAGGFAAVVPGGISNNAIGNFSFAAGRQAVAREVGAFVWADSNPALFDPYALSGPQGIVNSFNIRATGGFYVASAVNGAGAITASMSLSPSGTLVLPNGLLGVGLSSPTMAVDVQGRARLRDGLSGPATGTAGLWLNTLYSGPSNYQDIAFIGVLDATHIGFYGADPVSAADWGLTFDTSTGNVGIGTGSGAVASKLQVNGNASVCTLTITGGCDLSEPFTVSSAEAPKGSVMVIDPKNPGMLKLSERAYDNRVAGIVSGANGISPAISMQQDGVARDGQNVALTGRVYALANATQVPIEPGDLLTTSETPGHCMKVSDHAKAQGAILGKAMSSLAGRKGMVLVLVTLQ